MGEGIGSSVGIVHPNSPWRQGAPPPGNKQADQKTIIGLLVRIPSASGGMQDEWGTPPQPGPDGNCTQALADAIWKFQSFWKANGTFRNIDGVVDPGGNTLRVLNTCAMSGKVTSGGPNGLPPSNTVDLTKLAQKLRSIAPYPSRWTLENAPGAGGGWGIGGSIGQLDVKEDGAATRYLTYLTLSVGLGIDLSGSPGTFTVSTRDMYSVSGMGRIYSRTPQPLTFEDMVGPMIVIAFTGAFPAEYASTMYQQKTGKSMVTGMSLSIFLLGAQAKSAPSVLQPDPMALAYAAAGAKALCMSVGACLGFDFSANVSTGGAIPDKKRDMFDQVKQTDYFDPYQKRYDQGVKNMTDWASQKIKDWSPF